MTDLVHNKERLKQFRERAKKLIGQMTLEEKVYQTLYNAPAIERLGIASYNWWNEALHGVARAGTAYRRCPRRGRARPCVHGRA